jgi:hypothetical protein
VRLAGASGRVTATLTLSAREVDVLLLEAE